LYLGSLTIPQMMELVSARETLAPISEDQELLSTLLNQFILPLLPERDSIQRQLVDVKRVASSRLCQINSTKQASAGAQVMAQQQSTLDAARDLPHGGPVLDRCFRHARQR
jgi:hypothetical protein